MTHTLNIDIETPPTFEMWNQSHPVPFPAYITEINIFTDITNLSSTLTIGITDGASYPNTPPKSEWLNILSYLSNITDPTTRTIRLYTNTIILQNLRIPLQRGTSIAAAHYNNDNTNTAHITLLITMEDTTQQ